MEILGICVGIILGLFGSVFSVWQFLYQRKRDEEQSRREAEQMRRDAEQMEYQKKHDAEMLEQMKKRDAEIDHKDRMMFLAQVIMDKDIKKESRQPFYEEYISKGGNGSFVRYWLSEK